MESSDRFTLSLDVENTGGSEAADVVAFLHGIPIGTGDDSFKLTSGANPRTLTVSLSPPDERSNLRGDIESTDWDMRAPDLPEGITQPYEARARLLYRYKTTASTTVTALTSDEHRRLRERGDTIPSQTDTIVTKGPLVATIDARAPVVIEDDTDRIRLIVNIEVLQSGSVFNPDYGGYKTDGGVPEEELDKVRVRLFAPGVSATDEECAPLNEDTLVTLRRGTSTSLSCELKTASFIGRKDIAVRTELTYNFLTDVTTTLTVAGSKRSAPTGGTRTGGESGSAGTDEEVEELPLPE